MGRKKSGKTPKHSQRAAPPAPKQPRPPASPPGGYPFRLLPPLRMAAEALLLVSTGGVLVLFSAVYPILPGWATGLLVLIWLALAIRVVVLVGLGRLLVPLGLGLLAALRPWLDGITYPTDNFYFVWGMVVLVGVWGIRALMQREPIRFGVPILLLGLFWVVSAITAADTVQYDSTYRTLILWAGHFLLFLLATNALRTKTEIGVALTVFVIVSLVETAYSLIHLKYVIPLVRQTVMADPSVLVRYFGTTKPSAELVHRLQVNRAFGSLLFPNALAAFLILGIPYALGGAAHSIVLLARRRKNAPPQKESALSRAPRAGGGAGPTPVLLAGIPTWFLAALAGYFVFPFCARFEFPLEPGAVRSALLPLVYSAGKMRLDHGGYVFGWTLCVVVLPLVLGAAAIRITRRHGLALYGLSLRAAVFPLLFLLQLLALWLTFSRGGILALAMASLFTAGLLAAPRYFPHARFLRWLGVAGMAALILAGALLAPHAQAQQAPKKKSAPDELRTTGGAITAEGTNLSVGDLANPSSLRLRVSYWKSGWDMMKDNFWTGVGLGNFGVIYPKYQRPGAGDVKAAHNDFLQAICETGVFGFLFFISFWAYFGVWGALRLLREKNPLDRWVLAGLYAGVLAFLIHSAVDFNFFNPALAFFVFLLAGIFFSRAAAGAPVPQKNKHRPLITTSLLIVAALAAGAAVPVYWSDFLISGGSILSVGNRQKLNVVYDAGAFLMNMRRLSEIQTHPVKDLAGLRILIPDRAVLESIGSIRVPDPNDPQGHRALRPGEPLPGDNVVLMVTEKPYVVKTVAREYIEKWLKKLEHADAFFPHSPETAAHFIRWYEMIIQKTYLPEEKQPYVVELIRWSRESVARSPENFLYHQWLAQALWTDGNLDQTPQRWGKLEAAIAEHKKAVELYPTSAGILQRYGLALKAYGEALKKIGRQNQGGELINKAQQILRRVHDLQEAAGR